MGMTREHDIHDQNDILGQKIKTIGSLYFNTKSLAMLKQYNEAYV